MRKEKINSKIMCELFRVNNKDTNVPFLSLLNTPENFSFSGVFRGYRNGTLVSLLLTLNKFHILFWCFYHWLWTSKLWHKVRTKLIRNIIVMCACGIMNKSRIANIALEFWGLFLRHFSFSEVFLKVAVLKNSEN